MKSVTAYLRGEQLIFHTSSKTEAGFWICSKPILATTVNESPDVLGHLIKYLLSFSKSNVKQPDPNDNGFSEVLSVAGVNSWKTFTKNALSVSIDQNDGALKITPYKNGGSINGFEELIEKTLTSSSPSDQNLGETFLKGLKPAE